MANKKPALNKEPDMKTNRIAVIPGDGIGKQGFRTRMT